MVLLRDFDAWRKQHPIKLPICGNPECGRELDATELQKEPRYMLSDGKRILVCSDCYFGDLGKIVESYPIPKGP